MRILFIPLFLLVLVSCSRNKKRYSRTTKNVNKEKLDSFSQSNLDHLLFNKCNKYRSQNSLREWKWSDKAFEAALHHSKYQVKTGEMGHNENSPTPTPTSRLDYYGIDWVYSGENAAVVESTNRSNEQIAERILYLWKKSPPHNKLLLNPDDAEVGAISCLKGRNYKWSKNEYDWIFCTLTVFTE